MDILDNNLSLSSDSRIQTLIEEADNELNKIQPEIDYLQNCVQKLNELKLKKNKLLSLKASLKVILNNSDINTSDVTNSINSLNNQFNSEIKSVNTEQNLTGLNVTSELNSFIPDLALNDVKQFLRTRNNLNYEIFKAIVYNGGEASTEDIKAYLVSNKIKQPKTGKTFEKTELKEISSRANYLVRKNIIISSGPGIFRSLIGYSSNN